MTSALLRQPGGFEGIGMSGGTDPVPRFDTLPVAPADEDGDLLIEIDPPWQT